MFSQRSRHCAQRPADFLTFSKSCLHIVLQGVQINNSFAVTQNWEIAMGFAKWLARRGAVGGTARWAANAFRFFRRRHPQSDEFSDADIFRLMIAARYEMFPNEEAEKFLLSIADDIAGVSDLVVAILSVEAGFTENTPANQQMFTDIIEEELTKKGIRDSVIFGSSHGTDE